jgi:CheY-like chemotaxis protein
MKRKTASTKILPAAHTVGLRTIRCIEDNLKKPRGQGTILIMQPDELSAKPGTGKKVLCIEDEHFISELYERALKKDGYAVTTIVDGKAGLEAALTDTYDIILLDLMVPTMTGIEVLHNLRGTDQPPKIHSKIIITTNLEQRDDIRANIERHADGYLVKAEITPHELVNFLNSIA